MPPVPLRRPGAAKALAKAKAKVAPRPGAKAKGKAKAKAGGRARARGDPKRRGKGLGVFDSEKFQGGEEVLARSVPAEEWKDGLRLAVTQGSYWEEPILVAGVVKSLKIEGEKRSLELRVKGTQSEALLRWLGGHPGQPVVVDLCTSDCGKVSKDGLVHAEKVKVWTKENQESWMENMEDVEKTPVDELEELRRRSEALGSKPKETDKKKGKSHSSSSGSESEKRKEAKKEKKKKKKKRKKEERKIEGTKALAAVFGSTGLDPDNQVRQRVLRRAKRVAKKKGRRNSSGSSSSSRSSSSTREEEVPSGIFGEEVRVKEVAKRCPGALSLSTVEQIQTSVVQQSGQPWQIERGSIPPLFSLYWRIALQPKAGGPMAREMQTLSYVIDLLLQGRVAEACDTVVQRLKSLEQVAGGSDFRIAQRQELVPLEVLSMSSTKETLEASRLQKEEARAKAAAAAKGWERRGEKGEGKDGKGKTKWDKGKGGKGSGWQRGDGGKDGRDEKKEEKGKKS